AYDAAWKPRQPDSTAFVVRDAVRVAWQVYGEPGAEGDVPVLLLPTWCMVPAEVWKLQVPFLARRTRLFTFAPRGKGAAGRPTQPDAHRREELTRDALEVLDATGTDR